MYMQNSYPTQNMPYYGQRPMEQQVQNNMQQEHKKKNSIVIIIIIVLLLLILCCGISFSGGYIMLSAIGEEDSQMRYTGSINSIDYSDRELSDIKKNGGWKFLNSKKVKLYPNFEDKNIYFKADYHIYYDDSAIDFVSTQLEECGLTREEQLDIIREAKKSSGYKHYVCVVFSNIKSYEDGKQTDYTGNNVVAYVGVMEDYNDEYDEYSKHSYLYEYDLISLNTLEYRFLFE